MKNKKLWLLVAIILLAIAVVLGAYAILYFAMVEGNFVAFFIAVLFLIIGIVLLRAGINEKKSTAEDLEVAKKDFEEYEKILHKKNNSLKKAPIIKCPTCGFSDVERISLTDKDGIKRDVSFGQENNKFVIFPTQAKSQYSDFLNSYEYKDISRRFDNLDSYIFQRTNNVLRRDEKVRLENEVINSDHEIRKNLDRIKETIIREKLTAKLDKMISDYESALEEKGERISTKTNERISDEGVRSDLGDVRFRSSWEANIARLLNKKGIRWYYEKETLDLGNDLYYLPDFFLEDETFIEVKGVWDESSLDKVDAFVRTFPDKKLLIIDYDMYKQIETICTNYEIIENWEKSKSGISITANGVVVGMRFAKNQAAVSALQVGDSLIIEHDRNNSFDKYAISVKNQENVEIGHLEKKLAYLYSQKLDLGMTFDVQIVEIAEKIIKVKIRRNNLDTSTLHEIFN